MVHPDVVVPIDVQAADVADDTVSHINFVVGNEDCAWLAELIPLGDEVALFVQDLDAEVAPMAT